MTDANQEAQQKKEQARQRKEQAQKEREEAQQQIERKNLILSALDDDWGEAKNKYDRLRQTLTMFFDKSYHRNVDFLIEETLNQFAEQIAGTGKNLDGSGAIIMKIAETVRSKDEQRKQDGHDKLLRWFDLDREKAGERYVTIREMLAKFFAVRKCNEVEACVDKTLDRTERIITKGEEIEDGSPPTKIIIRIEEEKAGKREEKLIDVEPEAYILGVAYHILQEYFREKQKHEVVPLQALPGGKEPATATSSNESQDTDQQSNAVPDNETKNTGSQLPVYLNDTYHDCLTECMQNLDLEDRNLVLRYEDCDKKKQADAKYRHQAQANDLHITLAQLRKRAFTIREILKNCVAKCVKQRQTERK